MSNLVVRYALKDERAIVKGRASSGSAAIDLFAPRGERVVLPPEERVCVDTGVVVEIPKGHYGKIDARSGLALNNGIIVLAGVIDSDYRGTIRVILYNPTKQQCFIPSGKAMAQLLIIPIPEVTLVQVAEEELTQTVRGERGFGSSDLPKEEAAGKPSQ